MFHYSRILFKATSPTTDSWKSYLCRYVWAWHAVADDTG